MRKKVLIGILVITGSIAALSTTNAEVAFKIMANPAAQNLLPDTLAFNGCAGFKTAFPLPNDQWKTIGYLPPTQTVKVQTTTKTLNGCDIYLHFKDTTVKCGMYNDKKFVTITAAGQTPPVCSITSK